MYRMSWMLSGSAIALLSAVPAFAQEAAAPQQRNEANLGGDIVVTARRVEERLQDVPISITVFDQEALNRQNVVSGKDLATYTPSLTANARFGSDFASFAIRGFTQEARTTASVGVYFADAVVPRSSPLSAAGDGAGPGNFFDLQSVQVLKGPQGTLFGRNTTGGAVVLTPQRPTDRLEGYVEGTYGSYDMRRVQAVLNVPVSSSFQLRGGIDAQKRDGYLRNLTGIGASRFGDVNYFAARLSSLIELSPDVENYTVVSYTRSSTNGSLPRVTDCYIDGRTPLALLGTRGPNELGCQQIARGRDAEDLSVENWLPFPRQQLRTWQIVNNLKWVVSDNLTIKNINSYGQVVQRQAQDFFGLAVPLGATLRLPSSTAPYFTNVSVPARLQRLAYGFDASISPPGLHSGNQDTFTEELQFQGSNFDGKLDWQAGFYYEHSSPLGSVGTQAMSGTLCASEQEWASFTCTDASAVTGAATQTSARNYQVGKVEFRNIAIYSQASYDLASFLTVDAGLRYTWDRTVGSSQTVNVSYSAATGWNTPSFACINPFLAYRGNFADCTETYSQSSKAPTWMLGLNVKPTDDLLIYGKYSRGYRQGAISPIAAFGFKTYEPEKVDVYEAGFKSTFRGALRGYLNVSAFYNDFRDMQLQVSFLDLNGRAPALSALPAVVNAGKARIYGLEAEAMIQPVEGLTLQASYAYVNTKLQEFTAPDLSSQPAGGYDTVASTPVAGDRLLFTPDHKLSVTANYVLPLDDGIGRVSLGTTYIYTGKVFYGRDSAAARKVASIFDVNDSEYDTAFAPSYGLWNFNVNWEKIGGSPLDAQFFITNAFDKRYYEQRSLSGSRGFVSRYYGEPRMMGGRVRYSF